jgi:hypothetical protein
MSLVPKIFHQSSTQLLSNATCNLDNSLTSVLHYFVDRLPEGLQLSYRNIDKKKTVLWQKALYASTHKCLSAFADCTFQFIIESKRFVSESTKDSLTDEFTDSFQKVVLSLKS